MIPVKLFPEPADFDRNVRQRGLRFLATTPNPSDIEWRKHSYWQDILPDMSRFYHRICNYCATWIPPSTGQHSVDHFLDKKSNPKTAYEWDNYRYVSARLNSRKGRRKIVDPIGMQPETFIINFTNFYVEICPTLSDRAIIQLAENTIKFLKLNDDNDLVNERANYYLYYKRGEISFTFLQKYAPFIAYEILRQEF